MRALYHKGFKYIPLKVDLQAGFLAVGCGSSALCIEARVSAFTGDALVARFGLRS